MTKNEPKTRKFEVGDRVKLFEVDDYVPDGAWCYGVVMEIGDETFTIKWEDLPEETEYKWEYYPNIIHD